jgi:hypothetical protein
MGFRLSVFFAAAMLLFGAAAHPAAAQVVVRIDKSSQTMLVSVNGEQLYNWEVSTGRAGYGTPSGEFRPQWMARTYFSKKYYNSPMPHSIFFYRGYAIHGTDDIHRLGGPASHGCVRLHPRNAATLFALVERYGMSHTRIIIGDLVAQRRTPPRHARARAYEDPRIVAMTDRLMRDERIERQQALRQMARMRAADAAARRRWIRRAEARDAGWRRGARFDEPEVAIGVRAEPRFAIPRHVRVLPRRFDPDMLYEPMPR